MDILQREQVESGVLTLTLNRPERKNALDIAPTGELVRGFDEALELECTSQSVNLATRDTREGLKAFFERRAPKFEGR